MDVEDRRTKPELDGFHDLMDDSEQALFDLAVAREHRQEQLGYVAAEQARAFLQSSRQSHFERENTLRPSPIATAYMRVAGAPERQTEAEDTRSESADPSPDPAPSDVAAFIDLRAMQACYRIGRARFLAPWTNRHRHQASLTFTGTWNSCVTTIPTRMRCERTS